MDELDFNSSMSTTDAEGLRRSRVGQRPNLLNRFNVRGDDVTNGSIDDDQVEPPDQTEVFQQVIAIIRWGVLGLIIILITPPVLEERDDVLLILLLGFAILTVVRHLRPIRFDAQFACDAAILTEIGLSVAAVSLTGMWSSPFAVSLTVPIIVAGFARGVSYAVRVALLATAVPTIPELLSFGLEIEPIQRSARWAVILLMIALIAGQTRRITGEARRQRSLAEN